jgi:quercetin dioxygenase-like cupin family protein
MRIERLFNSAVITACGLVAATASAQAPAESALAWSAEDSRLEWGACPAFLPQGCQIAVLHGDPAKPNVDVFLKVPARSTLALHWHSSAERMVLVAGELHVNYEGQQPLILKTGSYAFGPAGRPHAGECVSAVPCVLFIAFESPLDAVPVEGKSK